MPFLRQAPAIKGVASKNEKRAAVSRVIPRKSPAAMVEPERETPGMTANAQSVEVDERVRYLRQSFPGAAGQFDASVGEWQNEPLEVETDRIKCL